MVSPTIREWIDICLSNDFGLFRSQYVPSIWDMVFHVDIHGIWSRRNAWCLVVFWGSCESDWYSRWIEVRVREWGLAMPNYVISLEYVFCTLTCLDVVATMCSYVFSKTTLTKILLFRPKKRERNNTLRKLFTTIFTYFFSS